jgi:hypothetical protein
LNATRLDALAHRFAQFAQECHGSSPLYERLSLAVAADRELLALAIHARPRQPPANLLFGATHALLLAGTDHQLAAFYPSLVEQPDQGDPVPAFRDFCLRRADEIESILQTRTVQTNEVRRSALLLPAFAEAARLLPAAPLALIEVGASAGLNLLWNRFGYRYNGRRAGDPDAPLQLACLPRGANRPPLPESLPPVAWRLGLDINPLDVCDEAAVAWLRALIWPEHAERVARLNQAVVLARQNPPPLRAGNALDLLPTALGEAPPDASLVVYDTFAINQFTPAGRERLDAMLADEAARRPLVRVSIGWRAGEGSTVQLITYDTGSARSRLLARCHPHGEWIEWI